MADSIEKLIALLGTTLSVLERRFVERGETSLFDELIEVVEKEIELSPGDEIAVELREHLRVWSKKHRG